MTIEEIVNKDYHEYLPSVIDSSTVKRLFQKKFTDDIGVKYFITIREWDFIGYGSDIKYEAETQLYRNKGLSKPVNVTFFSDWTLEEIEDEIEKIWQLGYDYYERF